MKHKLLVTLLIAAMVITFAGTQISAEPDDTIVITPPEIVAPPEPVIGQTNVMYSTINGAFAIDAKLIQSFMAAGIDPNYSVSLAALYTKLSQDPTYTEDLKIGFLAQVLAEAPAGMYELPGTPGTLSYTHWHTSTINDSQRILAGTTITKPEDISMGLTIPSDALIGCGMMQWTATRRTVLLNYMTMIGMNEMPYISIYDAAIAEANYCWLEMQNPYYNRIIGWSQGKDVYGITKLVCRVYIGQSSESEQEYRCAFIPVIQDALTLYNSTLLQG